MNGSYELTLRGEFSAAHQIRLYDGQLEPLHGHNWRVEIDLAAPGLDRIGVVADFVALQRGLQAVLAGLHDTFINDLPAFNGVNPTTEQVARHICERFAPSVPQGVRIVRVRVWETSGCAAAFLPNSQVRP